MVESYADYIHKLHYKPQYRHQKASALVHQACPVLVLEALGPSRLRYFPVETPRGSSLGF